jgi:branched-chain amino acid transport system ATP-binding protein
MSSCNGGLVVENLSAGYGSMQVVRDVSLTVRPGETVALIGRNGAGKTTTLSALGGLTHGAGSGAVRLGEMELTRMAAPERVQCGLALVPEGHRIFRTLSVRENLWLGASRIRRQGKAVIAKAMTKVFGIFPILDEYQALPAGSLSGGEQQMVAIGQALMATPAVLLLDEPTSGLAPPVVRIIYTAIDLLRQDGIAILVVEQSVDRALVQSDRYYVMERGQIAASGNSADKGSQETVSAIVRGVIGSASA